MSDEVDEKMRRFPIGTRVLVTGSLMAEPWRGEVVAPGPVLVDETSGATYYVRILRDGDVSRTPISLPLHFCEPLSVVDEIARLDEP